MSEFRQLETTPEGMTVFKDWIDLNTTDPALKESSELALAAMLSDVKCRPGSNAVINEQIISKAKADCSAASEGTTRTNIGVLMYRSVEPREDVSDGTAGLSVGPVIACGRVWSYGPIAGRREQGSLLFSTNGWEASEERTDDQAKQSLKSMMIRDMRKIAISRGTDLTVDLTVYPNTAEYVASDSMHASMPSQGFVRDNKMGCDRNGLFMRYRSDHLSAGGQADL